MGFFDWIGSLFKPAADIVESLDISGNKKQEIQNALAAINADVLKKIAEYDMKVIELQAQVAKSAADIAAAEAKSESWFVRMYKPLIITTMFILIFLDSFGLLSRQLPEIFVQVFGAVFGVVSVVPAVSEKMSGTLNRRRK